MRSRSGCGRLTMSPRLLTVAESWAALKFGWHGAGGCSAIAAWDASVAASTISSFAYSFCLRIHLSSLRITLLSESACATSVTAHWREPSRHRYTLCHDPVSEMSIDCRAKSIEKLTELPEISTQSRNESAKFALPVSGSNGSLHGIPDRLGVVACSRRVCHHRRFRS